MKTIIKAKRVGGSLIITPPKIYWEHMGIIDEQEIIISDEEGKYGKFVALYNTKKE
jgi:hypothetical protein